MLDWYFIVGKRPFGVSLLYVGWDKHYGFQLYQSDPSGNYGGWKATCIGNNSAVSPQCNEPFCLYIVHKMGCPVSRDWQNFSIMLDWTGFLKDHLMDISFWELW